MPCGHGPFGNSSCRTFATACVRWRPIRYLPPWRRCRWRLGIGANTAIYSFMDAILLRSLPVQHPEATRRAQLARQGSAGSDSRPERNPASR